ncbi:hypothetical protein SDC9_146250 [bioreactor metagenome]|uniref:Uncharacterized protein n=1 Tax=bioreactor metagenome TaxID=1076179 RepID=A0A645EB46_9ZZZZ|nr:hypothetical protein [Proteiniphilum sp.]MEA4916318.1 hypothetical protein [Proteiniphilum sp.]
MKKRNADLGEGTLRKINDYCHDLSIEWLITGKGEMIKLKSDLSSAAQNDKMLLDKIIELTKENTLLRAEINKLSEQKKYSQSDYPNVLVAEPKLKGLK